MKKICNGLLYVVSLTAFILSIPLNSTGQIATSRGTTVSSKIGLGFRIGMNLARVNGQTDSIQYDYKPGIMVSVFLSPNHKGILGYRSEILYSKQGFRYTDSKGNAGSVSNDYIMMPQMMTINITRYVQLQAGAFAGYLLRSKNSEAQANNQEGNNIYIDLMNRLDYGAAAGIEIHPFKGLIINGRYNMGFSKLYKEETPNNFDNLTGMIMPFSNIDTKNAVIQLSIGYQL